VAPFWLVTAWCFVPSVSQYCCYCFCSIFVSAVVPWACLCMCWPLVWTIWKFLGIQRLLILKASWFTGSLWGYCKCCIHRLKVTTRGRQEVLANFSDVVGELPSVVGKFCQRKPCIDSFCAIWTHIYGMLLTLTFRMMYVWRGRIESRKFQPVSQHFVLHNSAEKKFHLIHVHESFFDSIPKQVMSSS